MEKTKVIVLLTCYNRREKTENAIKKINKCNLDIEFLVVDDGSTDGTLESIKSLEDIKINVLEGNGNLYYSGGMRMGMEYLINNKLNYDYLLIINDDVDFYNNFLEKMVMYSKDKKAIIIGPTVDDNNILSYGGVKYKNSFSSKIKRLGPDYTEECDTFNANCVLIPYEYFIKCGPMDKYYIHSIGDFDYGFQLRRCGYKLFMFNQFVGVCNRNSIVNTWQDKRLSIKDRLKKKEQIKGLPLKQNFYYFCKNFNIFTAIKCSVTPYIRILIKK